MKVEDLDAAEKAANEFIRRVVLLRTHENDWHGQYIGSKLTASVRRASMDLTRALSVLRGRAGTA